MAADKDRFAFIPRRGAVPMQVERAEGAYLHTTDGRTILDAAGGAIVSNIGHGRAEVAQAMARAAEREAYVVPVFATEARLQLVDRLRESWLPESLKQVYLSAGGSDAIDAAIRLARSHFVAKGELSRHKIIGRDLSYHGATLSGLAAGGHSKRRAGFEPLIGEWPKAPACYCLRCPLGRSYPSCAVDCVEAVERRILAEGPETVAAVIAEPVGGSTAGALAPPPEYWPRLREICDSHDVLLIADEVMTGFGRTGRRFAVEHWNVVPDILVGGKGLAGGYAPIGGLYTSEAVVEPLAESGTDLMFYTFGAHSAACAAADTVLEILEREQLVARAAELGRDLRKRLAALESHPHVGEVRGEGLLLAVEFVKDRSTLEPFPAEANFASRVLGAALREGVFFYPGGCGPAQDVVVMGPAFIVGEEEIERIGATLERAVDSAARYTLEGERP